ncbi:mitochondrial ribosomal protein L37-domain-containing protein [Kickxella alabastrina]|uniref:mitochondrial ribosomal protein L37-domain-containing protein n=1 Tax=Kickxella alabastrina TaxID=61397 RepID=UPI00221FCC2C|nr:mitochondrial ribosomal protein L37-domain-containing protein [Kickxella alabastrina]KAI7826456.1 mitochondrial ribosomal protein L37-domain-containing protein [Kickxella alabastrina]
MLARFALTQRKCISRGFAFTAIQRTAEAAATTTSSTASEVTQQVKQKTVTSSAAQGTVLKGLNIYKEGKDPVALKDEEYPGWLWTLLDVVPEEVKEERVRQRLQRSREIKEANFMKSKKK